MRRRRTALGPPSPAPDDGDVHAKRSKRLALDAREREVRMLVGGGLTNEEGAERLGVSPATARLCGAQLVVFAYRSGLVRQV